jgi:DNA polymerase lambda
MEIIETGDLRRIGYEKTDDVEAINLFRGIYGVGMKSVRSSFVNLLIRWHRPTNSFHVVQ